MTKELSTMTMEELWKLFPISLVPHNEQWSKQYDEMHTRLCTVLSDYRLHRISHIGSTAIKEILAKDIIDILIEIEHKENIENVAQSLESHGFLRMSADKNRISLNLGYTAHGFADKVYHLHLRYQGDNDELYFRDYLNTHPKTAKEYEQLKLCLWKQYENNRDAYTKAKSDFVSQWTTEAKRIFKNRY